MGSHHPIRQLVRIGEITELYSSPLVELHLRGEVKSQSERDFAQTSRPAIMAQAV
jgi:hypothetical protein